MGIYESVAENQLAVYPNPAHDRIYLKMDNIKSLLLQEKLHCFDALGREMELSIINLTNESIEISTENLSAGIYLIRLNDVAVRLVVW